MTKNTGKWLEKHLQSALQEFQARRRSFFHRFPDSHAAGSWLPAQPGDYLWLLPGLPAILIEAKSTDKGAPLRSLLDPGQCGKHRLWQRAGHISCFIYAENVGGQLRWYEGQSVLEDPAKASPLWEGAIAEVREMLLYAADHLQEQQGPV